MWILIFFDEGWADDCFGPFETSQDAEKFRAALAKINPYFARCKHSINLLEDPKRYLDNDS